MRADDSAVCDKSGDLFLAHTQTGYEGNSLS